LGLEVEPCKNSLGLVILDVKAGYEMPWGEHKAARCS
jgi:hypothetical protein